MAENQKERHETGRLGESVARKMLNGQSTAHKAPFDIVDFQTRIAYEVKTMSVMSRDLKIHICDSSWTRKTDFATTYGLTMVLIVVVIYGSEEVKVYSAPLVQSLRVNQMKQIA